MLLKRIADLEKRVEALENKVAGLESELQGQRERESQEWAEAMGRVSEKLRHPRDYDKNWNPIPKATRDTSAED